MPKDQREKDSQLLENAREPITLTEAVSRWVDRYIQPMIDSFGEDYLGYYRTTHELDNSMRSTMHQVEIKLGELVKIKLIAEQSGVYFSELMENILLLNNLSDELNNRWEEILSHFFMSYQERRQGYLPALEETSQNILTDARRAEWLLNIDYYPRVYEPGYYVVCLPDSSGTQQALEFGEIVESEGDFRFSGNGGYYLISFFAGNRSFDASTDKVMRPVEIVFRSLLSDLLQPSLRWLPNNLLTALTEEEMRSPKWIDLSVDYDQYTVCIVHHAVAKAGYSVDCPGLVIDLDMESENLDAQLPNRVIIDTRTLTSEPDQLGVIIDAIAHSGRIPLAYQVDERDQQNVSKWKFGLRMPDGSVVPVDTLMETSKTSYESNLEERADVRVLKNVILEAGKGSYSDQAEHEQETDYSNVRPKEQTIVEARSISFLNGALQLPQGLRIEKRPTYRKDGSAGYALVAENSGAEVITFELNIFFRADLIPLLQQTINDALQKFDRTNETQVVHFRDPNDE